MGLRQLAKQLGQKILPRGLASAAEKAEEYARGMVTGGTLFEELGFYYVGPVDGHTLEHLVPVLNNIRDNDKSGPVLIHVVHQKGKGNAPPEDADYTYHGAAQCAVVTGRSERRPGRQAC